MSTLVKRWQDSDIEEKVLIGIAVAVVAFVAFALFMAGKQQAAWEQWCTEQGGRVDSHTDVQTGTGTGIGSDGKPVVVTTTTSNTTHYCIGPNGGILGVN